MNGKSRIIPHTDRRLQRHIVHDEASRGFPIISPINKATWHDKRIRIYDPKPNPDQWVGNCTCCSKASQMNAVGNRKLGVVLDMAWAMEAYHYETGIDMFPGQYPPEDTGSNGLASCKAAQKMGIGGDYRWDFRGADGVVQDIMNGLVMSVGTEWTNGMFFPNLDGIIEPTGESVGGHQYVFSAYHKSKDLLGGICWWGGFRRFWIKREHANDLIMNDGDAHHQVRVW